MRRTAFFIALLVASTTVAALALPAAAQPPPPGPVPTIRWSPCFTRPRARFECATVARAARLRPAGRDPGRIGLVRLPASDPDERIGSLFINPGGPGGSGVDLSAWRRPVPVHRRGASPVRPGRLRPARDHRPAPAACFASFDRGVRASCAPFAFPVTRTRKRSWSRRRRSWPRLRPQRRADPRPHGHRRRRPRHGPAPPGGRRRPAQLSSATRTGRSSAQPTPTCSPTGSARVVVDGVLDPIAWTTGPGDEAATLPFSTRLRSDAGAQATLDEFFRLCDEAGPTMRVRRRLADRFAALAERLLGGPVEIIDPFTGELFLVRYPDLIAPTLGAMYNSFDWPFFADFLAALEAAAIPGDARRSRQAVWDDLGMIPLSAAVPQLRRGLRRRGLLGLGQPRRPLVLVDGSRRRRRRLRLLRADLDLDFASACGCGTVLTLTAMSGPGMPTPPIRSS